MHLACWRMYSVLFAVVKDYTDALNTLYAYDFHTLEFSDITLQYHCRLYVFEPVYGRLGEDLQVEAVFSIA